MKMQFSTDTKLTTFKTFIFGNTFIEFHKTDS